MGAKLVFKRRDPRPLLRVIGEMLYPRGGWARAFRYVQHRLRRLPGSPERIGRGIWAGVFTSFTPLFGLHFVVAALIARMMKGNILAAIMATFFGNPLTFLFIGLTSLKTGYFLLGTEFDENIHRSFGGKFVDAWADLWNNMLAIFTDRVADWRGLDVFFNEVFFPYLVGGLIPGAIAATICYYLSVPLIRAYQKHRKGVIKAKFDAIRKKAALQADPRQKAE